MFAVPRPIRLVAIARVVAFTAILLILTLGFTPNTSTIAYAENIPVRKGVKKVLNFTLNGVDWRKNAFPVADVRVALTVKEAPAGFVSASGVTSIFSRDNNWKTLAYTTTCELDVYITRCVTFVSLQKQSLWSLKLSGSASKGGGGAQITPDIGFTAYGESATATYRYSIYLVSQGSYAIKSDTPGDDGIIELPAGFQNQSATQGTLTKVSFQNTTDEAADEEIVDLGEDDAGITIVEILEDTDGDTVPDHEDQCINEAGPSWNNGCPESAPPPAEEPLTPPSACNLPNDSPIGDFYSRHRTFVGDRFNYVAENGWGPSYYSFSGEQARYYDGTQCANGNRETVLRNSRGILRIVLTGLQGEHTAIGIVYFTPASGAPSYDDVIGRPFVLNAYGTWY